MGSPNSWLQILLEHTGYRAPLPPRPASLCQSCWEGPFAQHLALLAPPLARNWTGAGEGWAVATAGRYAYTTTWAKLASRARAGCAWCKLLLELRGGEGEGGDGDPERVQVTLGRDTGVEEGSTPANTQDFVIFLDNEWALSGHAYAAADNPAAPYFVARPTILDVGSAHALNLAKTCLADCVHAHPRCISLASSGTDSFSPTTTRLPTRLIDCTDPAHPRLSPTAGQHGLYAALSYVWGEPQPHSTTTANITAYTRGIDAASLPRTIRDAIRVTHALGLRFLWADTLCIVQDSDADKLRELGRMHEIYRYAHVTVVAASARRVGEGFLEVRRPSPAVTEDGAVLPELSFPFPVSPPKSKSRRAAPPQVGEVHISPTHMSNIGYSRLPPHSLAAEPVSARAWCMQELLMSPRVLLFATHTLLFRCLSATRHVGAALRPVSRLLPETHALPDALFLSPPPALAPPAPDPWAPDAQPESSAEWGRLHGRWAPLVRDYTRRTVGFPRDKLVACGALAGAFARVLRTEYLAGLWRATLLMDLLWQRAHPTWIDGGRGSGRGRGRGAQGCLPRPGGGYRAPSWSWAAVDGAVDPNQSTVESLLAVVLGCEVVLRDEKLLFGEVTGGFLVLRAGLIPCVRGPPVDEDEGDEEGEGDEEDEGEDKVEDSAPSGHYRLLLQPTEDALRRDADSAAKNAGEIRFDCTDDLDVARMWAVPIRLDDEYIDGLVVAGVPDRLASRSWMMVYRRVGYFRIYDEKLHNAGWELGKMPLVEFEIV